MLSSSITKLSGRVSTPFYYYDLKVLYETLDIMKAESVRHGFHVHYAVKANFNPRIMKIMAEYGFGADCVSGNEIALAIESGFGPEKIVFAGVGKTDSEIEYALQREIFCFNCESAAEIENIALIAGNLGKKASIAVRINPNVDAYTHNYITTGVEDSKFGVHIGKLNEVVDLITGNDHLMLRGIHFHIGSQILNMTAFKSLCAKANELLEWFETRSLDIDIINVGGGLGIDHNEPDKIPLFREYFEIFASHLKRKENQQVFFEIGRAAVGQCGSLISKVLYIKEGVSSRYAVIDAGMTDLLRPALYQAIHFIENLTSKGDIEKYNVVGPVCESADVFARLIDLPETVRGDILAIRSAGAYGEVMASRYNMRDLAGIVFSDEVLHT